MAQYESSSYPARAGAPASTTPHASHWATGFVVFAAVMMVAIGSFHFLIGLAAVLDDTFYVVHGGYAMKVDVTAWGWAQMIAGVLVALAGIWLFSGSLVARIVGIVLATMSMVWNFYSIPYYPVWSILIVAVDVGVIWALAAHGGEFSKADATT